MKVTTFQENVSQEPESIATPDTAPSTDVALVECPLCSSFLPSYAIEVHASQCGLQETNPLLLENRIIVLD